MRELEFLPDWYPKARRRRRAAAWGAYAAAAAAVGMGLWLVADLGRVQAAEARLGRLGGQLDDTRVQLRELQELRDLEARLREQEKILRELGLPVDMAALLAEIDRCAPPRMTVTNVSIQTEETIRPLLTSAASSYRPSRGRPAPPPEIDRWLRVRVQGMAPTDIDVANFFAAVNAVPFFQQANIRRSDQATHGDRLAREFEIDFALELNPQQE